MKLSTFWPDHLDILFREMHIPIVFWLKKLFSFSYWFGGIFLYVLDISALPDVFFSKVFFYSMTCLFLSWVKFCMALNFLKLQTRKIHNIWISNKKPFSSVSIPQRLTAHLYKYLYGHVYSKTYSSFIWNSNSTGCPVFLFVKYGNSTHMYFFGGEGSSSIFRGVNPELWGRMGALA